jgi:hypothetical protein
MNRPHYITPPMEESLPLFAAKPPAQVHSATSRAAADGIKLLAAGLRGRVLSYIDSRGAEGATDEEIATGTGINPSTARPRRVELANRGLVVKAGTRKTASGRSADVWTVTTRKGA